MLECRCTKIVLLHNTIGASVPTTKDIPKYIHCVRREFLIGFVVSVVQDSRNSMRRPPVRTFKSSQRALRVSCTSTSIVVIIIILRLYEIPVCDILCPCSASCTYNVLRVHYFVVCIIFFCSGRYLNRVITTLYNTR